MFVAEKSPLAENSQSNNNNVSQQLHRLSTCPALFSTLDLQAIHFPFLGDTPVACGVRGFQTGHLTDFLFPLIASSKSQKWFLLLIFEVPPIQYQVTKRCPGVMLDQAGAPKDGQPCPLTSSFHVVTRTSGKHVTALLGSARRIPLIKSVQANQHMQHFFLWRGNPRYRVVMRIK